MKKVLATNDKIGMVGKNVIRVLLVFSLSITADWKAAANTSDSCNDGDSNAKDTWGDGCDWYRKMPGACGNFDDADFIAKDMCCVCKETSGHLQNQITGRYYDSMKIDLQSKPPLQATELTGREYQMITEECQKAIRRAIAREKRKGKKRPQ